MKKIFICIVTITMLSCTKDDNSSELRIRLLNISQFNFQNITVSSSTELVDFEDINAEQATEYKIFQKAYRYAYIELEIDGETYMLQPADYVGEMPLERGDYTYQINANDSQDPYGKLSLTLIVD